MVKRTLEELLEQFGGDEPSDRMDAVFQLGATGHPKAMEVLLHAIEEDPDETVRQLALVSLGDFNPDDVLPLLTRVASVGEDREQRIGALLSLRRVPGEVAFEALLTALSDDPDEQVRAAAAEMLGVRGDPRALPYLERAKKKEPASWAGVKAALAWSAITGEDYFGRPH